MAPPSLDRGSRSERTAPWLAVTVLVASMLVFAILATTAWVMYDQAEERLVEERTREAATVLTLSAVSIETPLRAAARIAALTGGDVEAFESSMEQFVGDGERFQSAVLYRLDRGEPVASVGEPILLGTGGETPTVDAVLESLTTAPFVVVDLLQFDRHLGYAVADDTAAPAYVVYGEVELNPDPNVRRQTNAAFSQLDYAIYLNEERPEKLLGSSLPNDELPIDGRRHAETAPLGNHQMLIVMTPIGHMSGWLFVNLWWIVAAIGIALALVAAWLTRSLYARRDEALALAADNARLYDEQRHIAETLQLSLLPQELVPPPGGDVAARYWPAGDVSLIGGDFYDAFPVDEHRWGVVIGDVCGKGIDAAAITGLARHTLRAAARPATSPSDVLRELHRALQTHEPATFCTVCFLYITVDDDGRQTLTLALGGHPPPLLRRTDGHVEEVGVPGTLLGLIEPRLVDVTVQVEPGDTLVLYTDGLTDAPQDQAVPLDELIELLETQGGEPVSLLADSIRPLKRRRRPRGSFDDTAILVVRFGDAADYVADRGRSLEPSHSA